MFHSRSVRMVTAAKRTGWNISLSVSPASSWCGDSRHEPVPIDTFKQAEGVGRDNACWSFSTFIIGAYFIIFASMARMKYRRRWNAGYAQISALVERRGSFCCRKLFLHDETGDWIAHR